MLKHIFLLIVIQKGVTCFVWCIFYYFLAANSAADHPRISAEERDYLMKYSCTRQDSSTRLPVPWKAALLSVPVHAMWVTTACTIWVYYVISMNVPLFVNEVGHQGILQVYISSS